MDAALREGREGLDLPCKLGCDDCCHESVFLSAPEMLAVANAILAWPDEARREVVDQMLALADRYADELELLEILEPGAERNEVAARVKFRCPLLDGGGGCRVYSARELNARTFGQTCDEAASAPYGCELTHARLAILGQPSLPGARAMRHRLVSAVPGTERVHVYPWWFAQLRDLW